MKILHFISSLGRGGAEKLVVDLLPLLEIQGIEVCLVSMTDELAMAPLLEKQGVSVYTLNHQGVIYRIDRVWQTIKKLKVILKKEKPDILHSHLYMPDLLARLAVPSGYRLITTLHNEDSWWNEKRRLRSVLKTRLDALLGQIRKARYIAVSKNVKKATSQALLIPEKRIRIIYNGINLSDFHPKRNFEISKSPAIIQVGRFYKQKGHRTSLKALQIVKQHYPDVKLFLVGDGPLRSFIECEVNRLGLTESIEFLGVRDDVHLLLQQADIYWMPSEWEGFGIACLEAMACELPVVATSVGGLQEVVTNKETGYLIPKGAFKELAEKTTKILSDLSLAKRMGQIGRRKVEEQFSIEKTVSNYVKAYKDLLEGKW